MEDFKNDHERHAFLVETAREFLKADINVLARLLKRDQDGTGTANLVSGFNSAVVAHSHAADFFAAAERKLLEAAAAI
jgi:hypothetical protein